MRVLAVAGPRFRCVPGAKASRWAPVLRTLEAVREDDLDSSASSVRGARSLRVAMLEDV